MKKSSLKVYETDSSQIVGRAGDVLQPETILDLGELVKRNKSLTIRGGGTGLAGGAVPLNEVVLDISKIDKIIEFNKTKKIVIVEAGIILDDLQDFLFWEGLEFPINPSSHSICTIGGMISTNAVGSRALKYGRTADWVLWIDVLNSFGEVERKNKAELADYAGMEGITGIIVRAGLKLTEKKNRTAQVLELSELKETIEKVKELKQNPDVSMIEFADKNVSKLIGLNEAYHLFVEKEIEGASEIEDNREKYNMRDKIYPKLSEAGFTRIEDPKLMLDKISSFIEWLEEKKIPVFGHISSGILHPCFSKEQERLIPELMRLIKRLNGQLTGEHGIGVLKKEYLDPNDKKILINIKKRLDPLNKFNPGKVL